MKIAYCFSGLIRNLDYTSDKWLSIINKYPGDIYGSFWDVTDRKNNDNQENFVKIYNPKKIEIENLNNFHKTATNIIRENVKFPEDLKFIYEQNILETKMYPLNLIAMYYKIWKANQLSIDNDYDIVIRCRTDIYPTEVNIEKNNFLNIPPGFVFTSWLNCLGICDYFAYGSQDTMNYYSSVFLYLTDYLKRGHYFHLPEHLLMAHMSQRKITVRQIPIDITMASKDEYFDLLKCSDIEPNFFQSYRDLELDSKFSFYKKI